MGVNGSAANIPYSIQLMTSGTTMCLLQETREEPVWATWGVTYRDVRILDSSNRLAAVYNLTTHDLGVPENFATLKAMFIAVANSDDADRDGLPDQWEAKYFPRTLAARDDDDDGDKFNNFIEFAFGTVPRQANSFPLLTTSFNSAEKFSVSFTRWAGSSLNFVVEGSTNLLSWSPSTALLSTNVRNRYDGTGLAQATYTFTKAKTPQPQGYFRIQLRPSP